MVIETGHEVDRIQPKLSREGDSRLYVRACVPHVFAQDGVTNRLVYRWVQPTYDQLEAVQREQIPHLGRSH